jgi:glutathione S-transferase
MSELTLYSNPLTANGIKMSLLFNAVNVLPKMVEIQLHRGEQASPKFLQLNPNGKIPVLVDGDLVLTESNAILQYVANKFQSPLWPQSQVAQAQTLKWLFWQASTWSNVTSPFAQRRIVLPHWGITSRGQIDSELLARFHKVMNLFNRALEGRTAIVGETLTIADLSLASSLIFFEEAQIPLENYCHIQNWLNHLGETSWWKQTKQTRAKILNKPMHMHP